MEAEQPLTYLYDGNTRQDGRTERDSLKTGTSSEIESDVELINAADQFPVGTEWFNGAEGHCALCDGGV
ncbi:hypothetical protein INR49_031167 [Caranx melampygus]|nr:hypothetical protein INR49_017707 [Caranx melampygus]KAG7238172.1 hypothetical protein INR49_031167 [Caranx melampygus]